MRPRKWTESAIKQAFDNFIKQQGRLPTLQEMYTKYKGSFPRPLSLKLTTGLTLKEYLKTNYPTYIDCCPHTRYNRRTKEEWVKYFIEQYILLNMPTELEYNKLREEGTPNTQTLAKIFGVTTWQEVLEHCDLLKSDRPVLSGKIQFEETLENYQKLNDKIQSILKIVKS